MSTKINVRSPFYISLTEPAAPSIQFDCDTAQVQNLSIDQQGQINFPDLAYGVVLSITSTDAAFSNNKFPTVSTDTDRDLTVRIEIPSGFSNSSDGYIDCTFTVSQPAYSTPTTCSDGPTTNGTIPAQTIDVDGDSEVINLSSYFTQGSLAIAGYNIYNSNRSLVNASVSGNNLTISSNAIGGSTTINVSAFDNGSNTCTATQSISVTVNNPTVAFTCNDAAFSGGSIAQDGTLTKPNSVAVVGQARTVSGDASSNITNYTANNTGSDRNVTIFFDLTIPAGYSNSGTLECSKTFSQPAALPAFTCELANLSGQQISKSGVINIGSVQLGSISSYSPLSFSTVSTNTARNVTFNILIPSGYSNTGDGSQTLACVKTITQPADIPICGTNNYKISKANPTTGSFCNGFFSVSQDVKSTATSIENGLGKVVCQNDSPMLGGNFYYAVSVNTTTVGIGTGKFFLWKIDDQGVIQDVAIHDCPSGTAATGGYGGSL